MRTQMVGLLTTLLLLAGTAHAKDEAALWLQAEPEQSELAARLRAQLNGFIDGAQVSPPPNDVAQMCGIDVACLQQAAAQRGLGELLVVSPSVDPHSLVLALHSVSDLGAVRQLPLAADSNDATLLAAGLRVWRPEHYTGELELSGLQVFDKLFLDGKPAAIEVPVSRHVLSVGEHQVEVLKVGDESRRETVNILFNQTVRLKSSDMQPPEEPQASASDESASIEIPDWLGSALLGAGAAGMIAAAGLGMHVALAIEPQRSWLRPQVEAGAVCSDGSSCLDQQLAALDDQAGAETGIALGAGLTGLAAAAAGVVLLVLSDDQPVF